MSPVWMRCAVTGLVIVSYGCAAGTTTSEVAGECAEAWGADVCTWAVMDGDALVEMGATVPLASIESAPPDAPFVWPPAVEAAVTMPRQVTQLNGATHLTVLWEPVGHPPATFSIPHFDFHFYVISPEERATIDCARLVKPTTVPDGYVVPDMTFPPELVAITKVETLVGLCVPDMGMHALDAVEMESPDPFDGTMIVGYYDERPIFIEPMISQAFLLERRSFDLTVPPVPGLEGSQPTAFRAEYLADQDAYRFAFSGFAAGD